MEQGLNRLTAPCISSPPTHTYPHNLVLLWQILCLTSRWSCCGPYGCVCVLWKLLTHQLMTSDSLCFIVTTATMSDWGLLSVVDESGWQRVFCVFAVMKMMDYCCAAETEDPPCSSGHGLLVSADHFTKRKLDATVVCKNPCPHENLRLLIWRAAGSQMCNIR